MLKWLEKIHAKALLILKRVTDFLYPYRGAFLTVALWLYVGLTLIFVMVEIGFDESKLLTYLYFLCQESGSAGFLVWLFIYLSVNTYRTKVLPVLLLSISIFIWDIISYLTGIGVNNRVATGIVFGIATLGVILYMIRDLKWRRNH